MTRIRLQKRLPPFSLDVDFEIAAGPLALFGPPGSGKTMLLDLIAGFDAPDTGRILLEDAILYDAEAAVMLPPQRRACGYVAARDTLFPHMTVRQNVAFAASRLPGLERQRRVAEMLDRFALTAAAAERPPALPPAIRRDAAVARALMAEPKMLLLDERGWDEASLRLIRETSDSGLLFVTGDFDLCCAAAAEMIVLESGRIVQRGAPRTVAHQPESPEAARLLGFENLFQGTIAALDPSRNSSRIELDGFSLNAAYLPGHFRGDRVWVAIHPADVRLYAGGGEAGVNTVPTAVEHVSERARSVRVGLRGRFTAELSPDCYAALKDQQNWQIQFPPAALRIF